MEKFCTAIFNIFLGAYAIIAATAAIILNSATVVVVTLSTSHCNLVFCSIDSIAAQIVATTTQMCMAKIATNF